MRLNRAFQQQLLKLFSIILFLGATVVLTQTKRYEHVQLISAHAVCFGLLFTFIKSAVFKVKDLIVLAVASRLLFIDYLPLLSEDFYRFIWDGFMTSEGYNVYTNLPANSFGTQLNITTFSRRLFEGMSELSATNFSNYPPLAQVIYYLNFQLFGENLKYQILGLRIVNWLAEMGSFYFLWKLLHYFECKPKLIFWLVLNPLVLLEITGNLHFEGAMMCFFLGFVYFFLVKKWFIVAISFLSLSILSKLLPLMVLPLILFYPYSYKTLKVNFIKGSLLCVLCLLLVGMGYWGFLNSDFFNSYSASIGLWFSKFEFNASIYYILRELGFYTLGYNAIGVIGKGLAVSILGLILVISLHQPRFQNPEQFIQKLSLIFLVYLLLSTTVHPWYIVLPLGFSLLSKPSRLVFIAWSGLLILSYVSYKKNSVEESTSILLIEYGVVYALILYNLLKLSNAKNSSNTKTYHD